MQDIDDALSSLKNELERIRAKQIESIEYLTEIKEILVKNYGFADSEIIIGKSINTGTPIIYLDIYGTRAIVMDCVLGYAEVFSVGLKNLELSNKDTLAFEIVNKFLQECTK